MAASIEAGSMSDKDLIILTPTLEELGLLEVEGLKQRWEQALRVAEDMRAANIAERTKSKDTQKKLLDAADVAVKKAVEEVATAIRVYFMVDISGSMEGAIEAAKAHIARFLQAFPERQVHIAVFNTTGREIRLPHASAAGVENAFRGIKAGGGTDYGAGVRALEAHRPGDQEDVLFIFVGDEQAGLFDTAVRTSGLDPMAFGFVKVGTHAGAAVRDTAAALGIPCFMIDERTFADPYAVPRTIRALIAATPVGKAKGAARASLVDMILKTELLAKPAWASAS
jgi:hypothetical protein